MSDFDTLLAKITTLKATLGGAVENLKDPEVTGYEGLDALGNPIMEMQIKQNAAVAMVDDKLTGYLAIYEENVRKIATTVNIICDIAGIDRIIDLGVLSGDLETKFLAVNAYLDVIALKADDLIWLADDENEHVRNAMQEYGNKAYVFYNNIIDLSVRVDNLVTAWEAELS